MQFSPVVALVLLFAAANAELQRAEASYRQLEFDAALSHLDAARLSPATDAEYQRIVELTAFVHVIYERNDAARVAFDELLTARPDYALPSDVSPKIAAVFEEAKAARRARAAIDAPLPASVTTQQPALGPEPPVYRRWWFWTAAAVVAAGALTTVLLLTRDGEPDHDFGPIEVR